MLEPARLGEVAREALNAKSKQKFCVAASNEGIFFKQWDLPYFLLQVLIIETTLGILPPPCFGFVLFVIELSKVVDKRGPPRHNATMLLITTPPPVDLPLPPTSSLLQPDAPLQPDAADTSTAPSLVGVFNLYAGIDKTSSREFQRSTNCLAFLCLV